MPKAWYILKLLPSNKPNHRHKKIYQVFYGASTMVVLMFWPITLLKKRLINHISTSKWGVRVQGNLVGGVIGCQVSKFSTAVYCLQVELSFLCLERYRYSIWQRPCLFHCWWDSRSPEERKRFQSSPRLPLGLIMAAPGTPPPPKKQHVSPQGMRL